jgi:peroxiredoxin
MAFRQAPPLEAVAWFNTDEPLTLERLRGRIVLLHVFHMRCAACTEFATPQAQRVHEYFESSNLTVLGLHSVFENHEAQTPDALARHIREQHLTFPIAVDARHAGARIPRTMQTWGLDGTPTAVLIDELGRIRMKNLGHVSDLALGAAIGSLGAQRDVRSHARPF